uniref:ANK_REP_REGION domain-containing protein n=1 Tax=Macrostomum lignano TaxID=282301 RepID=A0A1I8FAA3_9PLAT
MAGAEKESLALRALGCEGDLWGSAQTPGVFEATKPAGTSYSGQIMSDSRVQRQKAEPWLIRVQFASSIRDRVPSLSAKPFEANMCCIFSAAPDEITDFKLVFPMLMRPGFECGTDFVANHACIHGILHFNDVYNIEPAGHIGGAARFVTALRSFAELQPSGALFSGDVFSPFDYQHGPTRRQHLVQLCSKPVQHRRRACFWQSTTSTLGVDNLRAVQPGDRISLAAVQTSSTVVETGRPLGRRPSRPSASTIARLRDWRIGHRCGLVVAGVGGYSLSTVAGGHPFSLISAPEASSWRAKLKSEQSCDLVIALTPTCAGLNDRKAGRGRPHHIDIILLAVTITITASSFVTTERSVKSWHGTFRQFRRAHLAHQARPNMAKTSLCDIGSPRCRRTSLLVKLRLASAPIVLCRLADFRLGDLDRLFPMLDPLARPNFTCTARKDATDMLPVCKLLVDDEDAAGVERGRCRNYFTASG